MGYLTPNTLDEAFAAIDQHHPAIVAGGTDFYPALGDGRRPNVLMDVTGLEGFRGISRDHAGWRIGAATTWSELIATPLPAAFDGLKAAAREVGAVQIQNSATVAGNLCNASPAADGVPPLLTLDARVELVSTAGNRTLPLDEFIMGPRQTALQTGELMSAILVPDLPETTRSAFSKLGARRYLVISIAMVAVVIVPNRAEQVAEARIAVGACSPVARRLPGLEAALVGCPIEVMAAVASVDHLDPLAPIDDVRAPANYRLTAALELIRRALGDFNG